MSFVTHIIPESFDEEGRLILEDAIVSVSIGDVMQNGVLHRQQALKVSVSFKSEDTMYNSVFKGSDMIEQACEWLLLKTEGEFNFQNVGPVWLERMVIYSSVDSQPENE